MIEAALKYIGPNSANMCNVSSKDELLGASHDEPLVWDSVNLFSESQS